MGEMREVPQLSPKTGVSGDFWNEFHSVFSAYSTFMRGLMPEDLARQCIAEKCAGIGECILSHRPIPPPRHYAEAYPPDRYLEVITDENRERVERLDELIDELRAISTPAQVDFDRIRAITDEARVLIYDYDRNAESSATHQD